jgi:hypothetical protein
MSIHFIFRYMSEYPPDWNSRRKEVYRRDNYRCQNCGAKGGRIGNAELHAHHITPKSEGGSHSLLNLKTLCKDCHNDIHSSMNTTTSSSRRSTSSPYSFPDPEEVEVGLLGFIKTHIILLGIFYFLSAVGMLIIVSYGPVIQLQHHWTLLFISYGIFTILSTIHSMRLYDREESAFRYEFLRHASILLGFVYVGIGTWNFLIV